ncbi:MAG: hypothetical protein Q3999_03585 [Buchananella hordeovulneris]|nr:hypothetical protein [Buchananella hordeovulneris]
MSVSLTATTFPSQHSRPPAPVHLAAVPPSFPEGPYGPPGWSVRAGLWEVLADYTPQPHLDSAADEWVRDGAPVKDFVPLLGLGKGAAEFLLANLPPAQLADRQNLAPTLGALLRAAARVEGVTLCGYGIGPQRSDERVSIDAILVPGHANATVHRDHRAPCDCNELWQRLSAELELDALAPPDEIARVMPPWPPYGSAWRLWWD